MESKISMETNAVLLDVRTPEEHKSGYLEGAVLLPLLCSSGVRTSSNTALFSIDILPPVEQHPLIASKAIPHNIEKNVFICLPFTAYFAVGNPSRSRAFFIAPRL